MLHALRGGEVGEDTAGVDLGVRGVGGGQQGGADVAGQVVDGRPGAVVEVTAHEVHIAGHATGADAAGQAEGASGVHGVGAEAEQAQVESGDVGRHVHIVEVAADGAGGGDVARKRVVVA